MFLIQFSGYINRTPDSFSDEDQAFINYNLLEIQSE